MNDAKLYQNSNVMQRRDALLCLEEFGPIIKWKKGVGRIIDIGCGDGSVTIDIVKKYLPPNYNKIVGCDISEEMIKFANENYSSGNTEFTVLNIEGELPQSLRNGFDQAISFYALHWIAHQESAFTNIYDLLAEGGGCWLMFIQHMPIFDVYRLMGRSERWRPWVRDVERYVGPYHDSQEPEKEIKRMMEKIGFTNVEVNTKHMTFIYQNVETLKKALTAVNPFKIPQEMIDEYMEDFLNALHGLLHVQQVNSNNYNINNPGKTRFHYTLLIVTGNKPYHAKPPDTSASNTK